MSSRTKPILAGSITLSAFICGATLVSSASPRSATNSTAIIGSAICTAVRKNMENAVMRIVGEPSKVGVSPSGSTSKVLSSPPTTSRCPPVAKSSMVASIWWNLPKIVLTDIASGSYAAASAKPPKTSTRLPAAAITPRISWAT